MRKPKETPTEALTRKLAENKQAREKLAHEAAFLEAQQRQLARDARRRQWVVIGQLADAAGLLAYDLGTLEKAFARLADDLQKEDL
jgi:hypothetical protein